MKRGDESGGLEYKRSRREGVNWKASEWGRIGIWSEGERIGDG